MVELKYMKSKKTGYKKPQVHVVESTSSGLSLNLKVLKEIDPDFIISDIIQNIPEYKKMPFYPVKKLVIWNRKQQVALQQKQ